MTDQPSFIDPNIEIHRTALAFCRALALQDGVGASQLWNNSTTYEQSQIAVTLAAIANSHATVILAATRGLAPADVPRTMLAQALALKLQDLAGAPTQTQEPQ